MNIDWKTVCVPRTSYVFVNQHLYELLLNKMNVDMDKTSHSHEMTRVDLAVAHTSYLSAFFKYRDPYWESQKDKSFIIIYASFVARVRARSWSFISYRLFKMKKGTNINFVKNLWRSIHFWRINSPKVFLRSLGWNHWQKWVKINEDS